MTTTLLGLTVSHYRIIEPLGEGGMGVVYRGEDVKLSRPVALKFLSQGHEADRQMLDRFLREARTASALNHPNICTIYEIDEHQGAPFIAMEMLEGQALEKRIDGRPLDIDLMLDYAIQICEALEVAHTAGILHRDIKPANIFVTTRGQVKVLDFGLAKAMTDQKQPGLLSELQTEMLTTRQGVTLGTVAYMSPEQARGEDLDVRSDLFSFGVVLYEMATGHRTFEGSTSAVVFDAILNREPTAPIVLNANVPQALERIIARGLEKDRAYRYQSAAEIRSDLQRIRAERGSGTSRPKPGGSVSRHSGANWPSAVGDQKPATSRFAGVTLWSGLVAGLGVVCLIAAGVLFVQSMNAPAVENAAPVAPAVEITPAAPVADVVATPAPATPAPVVPATPTPAAASPTATAPAPAASTASTTKPATPATTPPGPAAATAATAAGGRATQVPGGSTTAAMAEQIRIARAKYDARLYDQAIADLRAGLSASPTSPNAPEAQLLVGRALQAQSKPDDAMAAFVELRQKYGSSPEAAEGTFLQASLVLQSRRNDREPEARRLYSEIPAVHPTSPWAPRALARRAALEDRVKTRVVDPVLNVSAPVSLATHRQLTQSYPTANEAEESFERLAEIYEDVRQYDLAAQSLFDLAQRFPGNNRDAAWRAGELFEKRVKDPQRATESYMLVPPRSSHYRDAQKKLQP